MRKDIIEEWIKDLRDPDFGIAMNANILFAVDDDGKFQGDASSFLFYRQSGVEELSELGAWLDGALKDKTATEKVSEITGMSYQAVEELLWGLPTPYIKDQEYERITKRQVAQVLTNFLSTGKVDWNVIVF